MSLFPESSELPSGRAVLLSILPRYADLILAGTKRVELRRSWPSNDIGVMVLYSSSPVRRLVGVAYVDRVNETDVAGLWRLACDYGGGLTHEEFVEYFEGKKTAFGIMIKSTRTAQCAIDPKDLFPDFAPPQSFQYLTPADFQRVMRAILPERLLA
ncbi:MAG: ASCH domain-containing protein [Opitutaceae bacterium]